MSVLEEKKLDEDTKEIIIEDTPIVEETLEKDCINKYAALALDRPCNKVHTNNEARRAAAYREEADPLMFKAMRGEVPKEEWLDKVAEIRARWPNIV